jgi:hypothetical protein
MRPKIKLNNKEVWCSDKNILLDEILKDDYEPENNKEEMLYN